MDEDQKAGLDHLERIGYLPVLRELGKSMTAPFWWHDPNAPVGSAIGGNGTICFVDTGARTVGITAGHVLVGYQKAKEGNAEVVCQIGGATFQPDSQLIHHDESLDLATFHVSEIQVAASRSEIHRARVWPPPEAQEQELILTGGYPGHLRTERGGETDFDFASFVTRIDSSSSQQTGTVLRIAEAHAPPGVALPPNADLGGCSGGPVYRVHEHPVTTLQLVGIAYEYSPGIELIYSRHATSIRPDGTLDPSAV